MCVRDTEEPWQRQINWETQTKKLVWISTHHNIDAMVQLLLRRADVLCRLMRQVKVNDPCDFVALCSKRDLQRTLVEQASFCLQHMIPAGLLTSAAGVWLLENKVRQHRRLQRATWNWKCSVRTLQECLVWPTRIIAINLPSDVTRRKAATPFSRH